MRETCQPTFVESETDMNPDELKTIEKAAMLAWPPVETAPHRGWLMRAGGGRSRRLNSVSTLYFDDPRGRGLDAPIDHVEAWYRARSIPPCFHLASHVEPGDLDDRLAGHGYAAITPTGVMTAPISADAASADIRGGDVLLEGRATALVMNIICDPLWSARVRGDRAAVFARIRRPLTFAVITLDGIARAGGLCVADGELAGIFSVRTDPAFRRRGLARALMARLGIWAHGMGARRFYLQVEDDNQPAINLYGSLGFERIYGYHYRQLGEGRA